MSRHHVHLSLDLQTARQVGARRGKPIVLEVDAAARVKAGFEFYCSENKVWLVNFVPKNYLKQSLS